MIGRRAGGGTGKNGIAFIEGRLIEGGYQGVGGGRSFALSVPWNGADRYSYSDLLLADGPTDAACWEYLGLEAQM